MRNFVSSLLGGVVVLAVAGAVGLAQNAVRSNPLKLIQRVPASATASQPAAMDTAQDTSGGHSDAPAVEGAITLAEMKRIFDEGLVVIIDARGPGEYAEGHIPGAINVPYDQLSEFLEDLQLDAPMDVPVVCYCRGPKCDLSDNLATELRIMGYKDVKVFPGGWEEWTAAGHPVTTGTGR